MNAQRIPLSGRQILPIATVAVWFVLVGAGMKVVLDYQRAPGSAAQAPTDWPDESGVSRASSHLTLVMTVHPRCPCSRASLGELAILMAHTRGRLEARVLFVEPSGFGGEWVKSDLWQSATIIPNVEAIVDPEGVEARRFGATTSGQTLLYSSDGRLLFSGGITAGRGRAGDNAGRESVVALVNDMPGVHATPVYGCALEAPEARELPVSAQCPQ